jgi:hypothetical protein
MMIVKKMVEGEQDSERDVVSNATDSSMEFKGYTTADIVDSLIFPYVNYVRFCITIAQSSITRTHTLALKQFIIRQNSTTTPFEMVQLHH